MAGYLLQKLTRFRAYQLGNPGSSFSYFDGTTFTLIEARLTDLSQPRVKKEMEICGVRRIGCLHITSWDTDHCAEDELKEILDDYMPSKIELPGYAPQSDEAIRCRQLVREYKTKLKTQGVSATVQSIDPDYIKGLNTAEALGYRDVIYHPKYLSEKSNDNSTVKLFRTGCFNFASLGDVENPMIGAYLRRCSLFASEVDVLILAHHGADNGLTTRKFLKAVKPTIAICSSNYDNQYDHPRPEIRALLHELKIDIYTTKTGDVAVQSTDLHTREYRVINLRADSTEISSTADFKSKKSEKLKNDLDTIRNVYGPRRHPFRGS
jgi:competence protein ComEC